MKGCARIATELFPKINNQPDADDDTDKNKPPAPTITNFKPPVAVAYLNAAGAVVVNRGTVRKTAAPAGTELALSHDGKKLLYTRADSKTGPDRTIVLYDFDSGKSQDLVHGYVRQAFWSPDDSRIAFLKAQDRAWQVWSFLVTTPEAATVFSSQAVNSLHGWTDGHTLLASDMQTAYWLSDENPAQTVPLSDIYGPAFQIMSSDAIRVHPLNPDLLLVSADYATAPAGAPKDAMGLTAGFFLYELRARRRTVLCPPDQWGRAADWSRDGLQVFYTRMVTGTSSTFRIFWDGTGTQKYSSASWLVIGQ
jgi:WD40 repeat protein